MCLCHEKVDVLRCDKKSRYKLDDKGKLLFWLIESDYFNKIDAEEINSNLFATENTYKNEVRKLDL